MVDIRITNQHGRKQRVPLSTSAQLIRVIASPTSGGRVQLASNSTWLYSSQDEGSTADNWLTVAAGAALTFDSGSGGFTFYAKHATATPNLHILEL